MCILIRNSKSEEKISESHLSEKYLERCLERKNGFPKGWVKNHRETDPDSTQTTPKGWGVFGQKQVGWIDYQKEGSHKNLTQ